MSTAPTNLPANLVTAEPVTASVLDQALAETIRRQTLSWKVAETGEQLELSISHVRKLFANPTKSGALPTDRDCWLFLHLCKARGLNPYVGDAFLVGYDSNEGPTFSLITAHQALLKRAEMSGKKDGMESGVIVIDASGEERERNGDFYRKDQETLAGGWAKVYRTDWKFPAYERLTLESRQKSYGRWRVDPAGMIVKCAEASATRLAFPRETAAMYVREEMGSIDDATPSHAPLTPADAPKQSMAERMAADYKARQTAPQTSTGAAATTTDLAKQLQEQFPDGQHGTGAAGPAQANTKEAAKQPPVNTPVAQPNARGTPAERLAYTLAKIKEASDMPEPQQGLNLLVKIEAGIAKIGMDEAGTLEATIALATAKGKLMTECADAGAVPATLSTPATETDPHLQSLDFLLSDCASHIRLDELTSRWDQDKANMTDVVYQQGVQKITLKREALTKP